MNSTIILISFLLLIFSILSVTVSNPIHAVIYLIFSFSFSALLLLLLNVEFLAFILLIVYVGAIAILFLFIIMMLNIKIIDYNFRSNFSSALILLSFSFFIFRFISNYYYPTFLAFSTLSSQSYLNWIDLIDNFSNIQILGQILYTHYFFVFLESGFVLLVAMIGAIVLTLYHRTNVKRQVIYQQLSQSFKKNIKFKI